MFTNRAIFVKLCVIIGLISRLLLLVFDVPGCFLVIDDVYVNQGVIGIVVQYT